MKKKNSTLTKEEQKLMFVYKQVQDSAQHHDSLIWTTSSIFTGSSLIMLGTIIGYFSTLSFLILSMVSIIGFLICFLNFFLILDFNKIKNNKYERLKEIECELNIKHSKSGGSGIQKELYCSFLAIMMFIWIMLIVFKSYIS